MKNRTSVLILFGLLACAGAGLAQTNSIATPAAPPAQTTEKGPNGVASPPAAADVRLAPEAQAASPSEPGAEAENAAPNQPESVAASGPVIPLIVMDDVLLTDAIRNLARQAELNYMLDPKVAFGQTAADGKPGPQPHVSLRWENVSAQQALQALLNNYDLQLVGDPKSKIARVTVRDPAAPPPMFTQVFQLKYASPTNMLAAVMTALTAKTSRAVADIRTSQLVVLATEKELSAVAELIQKLDTPTKQVLIEARLVETSMNPKTSKGVDWSGTLAGQHVSFGNGVTSGQSTTTIPGTSSTATTPGGRQVSSSQSSGTVSTVLNSILGDGGLSLNTARGLTPNIGFLDADGVHAVISFLNQYADAKVLSAPRTVTLDNETAIISVTRASPIINVTPGTVQVSGGSQITYTNLGVILTVTPRISANNNVNLRVVPEVSRVFDTVRRQVASGVYEADEYDIRKLETHVMIPSGNTLVMGGMVQDDVRRSNTKVPLLGDIPFLGQAFRSDTKSRQKANLLVFITPTIVQDTDFQPTETGFLKSPVPVKDEVEEDWSAWNSGKPKDWGKKTPPDQKAWLYRPAEKNTASDLAKDAAPAPSQPQPTKAPAVSAPAPKAVPAANQNMFDESLGQAPSTAAIPAAGR